MGSNSSLGLYVSSAEKYGHDASRANSWYSLLTYTSQPNLHLLCDHCFIDAQLIYLSLSSGGFGWIPNLTDVDHSLILPVSMSLANLAIIQLQVMNKVGATSRLANTIMNVLRVLCVVMIPIAAYAPAVRLGLKTFYLINLRETYGYSCLILLCLPTGCRALLGSFIVLRLDPKFSPTLADVPEIFPDTCDTT